MSKKQEGKSANKMTLPELKELVVDLKIATEEEASKGKKADLLALVKKYEKKALAKVNGGGDGGIILEEIDLGLHNGKKVVSKTPTTLNGKEYVDILTDDGVTDRISA